MERRKFISSASLMGAAATLSPMNLFPASAGIKEKGYKAANPVRDYWVGRLLKIVNPVFENLAKGTLVKNMPVEKSPTYDSRSNVTYLEAVGRSLAGVAPWIALPDDDTKEGKARKHLKENILLGLKNAVNPSSPDYLNFRKEYQPIVDAAYLAHGFLRAKKALWEPLDTITKNRFITEFKALRTRKPFESNWLLFTALTEAFLLSIGEEHDQKAIDFALEKFEEWYVGDGWYSDGPSFAFDYYNSFVIHPMLVDTLTIIVEEGIVEQEKYDIAEKRFLRYVDQQERMISPVGTFPVIGRSITYRTGAFQALAQAALMDKLPEHVNPAQIRGALTAITKNLLSDNIFDDNNWLLLGFDGHQPEIADYYTSTGSLYMATLSFLPLGLPESHEFWSSPEEDWTSKKAWNNAAFKKDYHVRY